MTNDTLIQILQNGITLIQSGAKSEEQIKTMLIMSGLLRDRAQMIQQNIQQKMVDSLAD
jgi:ribosomal protein L11 methylase PrmA